MILTIIGARPQFIKAAPVSLALRQSGLHEVVLHTGQHFDHAMDRVFFDELGMDYPKHHLGLGGGSHAEQTSRMLVGIEKAIQELKPQAVLVFGDTNSTLAGALAAVKLHVPVAHVEAGLRSFDLRMPEEVNRRLTDHISHWLFCPSEKSVNQLAKEGITERVFDVGDVMLDAFQMFSEKAKDIDLPDELKDRDYYLFTMHRPSNTDDPSRLQSFLHALARVEKMVIWPVHPRVKSLLASLDIPENIRCIEPQSYLRMLRYVLGAKALFTDSGGLQKEAYWAKTPCITLRAETEWVETLENSWNQLVVEPNAILQALETPQGKWKPLYGDGAAGSKIAKHLLDQK